MPKRSKEELERIIERDLPGYTLDERETADESRVAAAEPDEATPDISELQRKYEAGADVEGHGTPAADDGGDAGDEVDDEIVTVRPKQPADPFDHSARPKTVVVSGEDGRIVGSQG